MITNVTKVKSAPYTVYQFELEGQECVISNRGGKHTLFTSCGDTMQIDGKDHVFWRGDDAKDFRKLFAIVDAVYERTKSSE